MDGSRVAIITRTKDRPLLLRRAIRSVMSQSYPDYIHIIVNDGGDVEKVRSIADEENSKAIIHSMDSKGHMEMASNEGIQVAVYYAGLRTTDYITIHDDDDSWSPEFLSIMIQEIKHFKELVPSVKGIVCRANRVYEKIEGNVISIDHLEPHVPMLPEMGLLRIADLVNDHRNFAPIQFLYEIDTLADLMGYDPSFKVYGDWDFNLRFLEQYDIALIPNYLAYYHWRLTSSGADENSILEAERKLQREVYRQRIQNKYLRKDGLGTLMNLEQLRYEVYQLRETVNELRLQKRTTKPHR